MFMSRGRSRESMYARSVLLTLLVLAGGVLGQAGQPVKETKINIVNETGKEVSIYWLNDGQPKFYRKLAADRSYEQPSYVGHRWRAVIAGRDNPHEFVASLTATTWRIREDKEDPQRIKLVVQTGHTAGVNRVALSGDGKHVVTGSNDNTAILWEAASGKQLQTFAGHTSLVGSVALSGDGKYVVTGSNDNTAILWDVASGKRLQTFAGHTNYVLSVALSGDGKHVVTGSADKTAILWEAASGKQLETFAGHTDIVLSVALSADGKHVVTGSHDKTAILWEAAGAKQLQTLRGHSASIRSVSLSGDGLHIVTGSYDKTAILWEAASGKQLQTFRGDIRDVALSGDGKHVVTASWPTAILWEAASGKQLQTFRGPTTGVNRVALSGAGKHLVTVLWDGTVILWEAASGKQLQTLRGHSASITSVALSGDSLPIVTGLLDDKTPMLWEAASGKQRQAFTGHTWAVNYMAVSSNGKHVVAGSPEGRAILWEAASGKQLQTFTGQRYSLWSVALSGDGKHLVTALWDETAILWEVASGKQLHTFKPVLGLGVHSVALSGDGKRLLTGSGSTDKTAILWEAASGKQLQTFKGHTKPVKVVALSRDGKHVVTGSFDKTAILWDAASGKQLQTFRGHTEDIRTVALSGDGKHLLTGSIDKTAMVWETTSGKQLQTFRGHTLEVTGVALSGDAKDLWTTSRDHTLRLWDVATGKERCRLYSLGDGAWAVVDPDGRFDASNGGDVEGLHWVVGMEPIALKQFKERYYDPGLLAKHLGHNKQPLRPVTKLQDAKLTPLAEANTPITQDGKLTLDLTNRGGGIGKVQVFVNGRELLADARGDKPEPDAAKQTLTVDLNGAHVLPGQPNVVRIVTWNKEGYLSSRGAELEWTPPGNKEQRPIELHAIVVGVSSYASPKLNLRYAAKDAADFAKALTLASKRLFGADKVHVTLLCDEAKDSLPTRANLEKAFAAARKAMPGDILVVYLAGHGISLQQKNSEIYCYLTQEANSTNRDAFTDPAVLKQNAVTSAELTEWIKQIPALKQVLILDTCAAGAAASKLMEHRDTDGDSIRAVDRMRDRTGFHVLMGCASDKVSYEATQYAQGLLTYSLLEAMRGAKLREGEFVDVSEWFQHAADKVPQLAGNIGGIQKPLIMAPRGTSFDVGRLLSEDKKLIPLAKVRPMLLRPVMVNPDADNDDDLGLQPLLSKRLLAASSIQGRGKGESPALVYIDAIEMPNALRPVGTYTVDGDKVRVKLALRRDKKTVTTLEVEGSRQELPELSERMSAVIVEALRRQ